MLLKRLPAIFLAVLCTVGCEEKELPVDPDPPQPPTPIFYVKGSLDGTPFDINGGVNNYYMYSSFIQDTLGIYEFIGELKPLNCVSNCSNSLKVKFRDYKEKTKPVDMDSALVNSFYSFAEPSGSPSKFSVHFSSDITGPAKNFVTWDFGDGTTSTQNNPTHIYKQPGEYTVCMVINGSNTSCDGSTCKKVRVGAIGSRCEAKITYKAAQNNSVEFSGSAKGKKPFTFKWDLGDGNFSTLENFTHTYSKPGRYAVSLSVTDSEKRTDTEFTNVATKNWTDCVLAFSYKANPPIANPNNLSNVIIEWTDDKGKTYSSYRKNQPDGSWFKVVKVENFMTNQNGQKTKKVHINVNCMLYNGNNSIQLNDAVIVFAVAHP